jgi:peptide/nickel transport system substrate-binding protein
MFRKLAGRRGWRVLAAVILMALPLAACGGGSGSAGGQGNGQPVRGGSATYLNHVELTSLDPVDTRLTPGLGGNVLPPLYDHLIWFEPDGKVVPRLAKSVATSDGKLWEFKLREGVKFSDGTPFDADAVKFNWERLRKPGVPNGAVAAAIQTIEVVDPLTLRVTLKARNRQWHQYLMSGLGFIGSPTAMQKLGDKKFATQAVGAGPFVLTEFVAGDHVKFARNPNYWDAPKPHLDELIVRTVPNAQQRYDSFEAGEADFVSTGAPVPQTAELQAQGYPVQVPQMIGGIGLILNNARAPLDDVRVRRALLLATNVDDFAKKGTGGSAEPIRSLFAQESPLNSGITRPAVDLAKAQALIDEYVAEKGGPVRITISVAEAIRTWAEVFQQQWAALKNVKVEVSVALGSEAIRRRTAGEFDVTTDSIIGTDPEPDFYDRLRSGSSFNYSRFNDPEVDKALDVGRSAESIEQRKAAYAIVERAIWEQAPYIFTVRSGASYAASKDIKNFQTFDEGFIKFAELWKEQQ